MDRLLLKTDDEREIVLDAPRTGAVILTVALVAVAVAVRLLFPGLWMAPAILGLFAVWALTGVLQVHRLRLDLDRGDYVYRRGSVFAAPQRSGCLDEIAGVIIERYEPVDGLVASRLRSRLVVLELDGWPYGEGRFELGFPMGPRIAEDKAADYARRLGTEVVDRTADPTGEPEVEPPD